MRRAETKAALLDLVRAEHPGWLALLNRIGAARMDVPDVVERMLRHLHEEHMPAIERWLDADAAAQTA